VALVESDQCHQNPKKPSERIPEMEYNIEALGPFVGDLYVTSKTYVFGTVLEIVPNATGSYRIRLAVTGEDGETSERWTTGTPDWLKSRLWRGNCEFWTKLAEEFEPDLCDFESDWTYHEGFGIWYCPKCADNVSEQEEEATNDAWLFDNRYRF
jgi:hypothetical protein